MASIKISEARHVAGHPLIKPFESCSVTIDETGIEIRPGLFRYINRRREPVRIPWSEILTLERDGHQVHLTTKQAGSRVTATRAAAFGVFALAARKQTSAKTLVSQREHAAVRAGGRNRVRSPDGEEEPGAHAEA